MSSFGSVDLAALARQLAAGTALPPGQSLILDVADGLPPAAGDDPSLALLKLWVKHAEYWDEQGVSRVLYDLARTFLVGASVNADHP